MKHSYALAAGLAAVALSITACSSSTSKPPASTGTTGATTSSSTTAAAGAGSITIGSADFPESVLLADIYGDAMSAKGVKVSKKLNIGERPVYSQALEDGSIGAFPEYSGSILDYLDPKATAKSPADVLAALTTVLATKNLVPLQYAAAQDSDTITVTAATATQYNLKSIGDLASVAGKLTFGAPAGFRTRPDGIPALKSVYGVTFKTFTPLAAGGTVTQTTLKNGTIDAGDIFSTDGSIAANHFVPLADPKNMFAAQNIVPIIAKDKNTPAVTQILNDIQSKLTTDGIMEMLDHAYNDKTDAAVLAKQWLSDNGLDGSGSDAKGVSLTVGSANFPENEILAEIYAQALSNHGATITKKLNIGSREKYLPALKSGSLSLFPEYNGTLLSFLDPNADATSTEEVDAALKDALPSNLESLDSAEAQDSDAIVVTQETADKYDLTTIGDLAKAAS